MRQIGSWFKSIERCSPIQTIGILLIIGLVLYGSLIIVENNVVSRMPPGIPQNNDINFYHNGTSAFIHGEIPYKEFSLESLGLSIVSWFQGSSWEGHMAVFSGSLQL